MGQFFTIFRNTMLEVTRQPAFGLVLSICCGLIAVTPLSAAQAYTFNTGSDVFHASERLIANLGLSTILLSGLILAVFSATSVISGEIERKTALTVLSKQVSRTSFVFAKYFGVSAAITLAMACSTMFLLLFVRVGAPVGHSDPVDYGVLTAVSIAALVSVGYATFRNYFRGRSWVGSFTIAFLATIAFVFIIFSFIDRDYSFALSKGGVGFFGAYDWDIAKAGILTLESVLILTGIAVACSTRLGVGGSFLVCAVIFVMGLTIEYFLFAFGEYSILHAIAVLIPNLQPFGMTEALAREKPIPLSYVASATMYAFLYTLATLFCAAFLFHKREIA